MTHLFRPTDNVMLPAASLLLNLENHPISYCMIGSFDLGFTFCEESSAVVLHWFTVLVSLPVVAHDQSDEVVFS